MKRGSSLWRSVICFLLCISLLFSYAVAALADQASEREGNQNYFSNQGKLVDDAFTMLPLGAVQPEEWLREQLLLQKEGLLGNMQDNYPIYSDSNGWRGGSGDTWEKGPYYFRGLTQTAFILDDEELKAKAMEWIDWTLDNQRENGFMGPSQDGDGTNKSWDWWPRMVVLLTLQDYYEATEYYGDPDERVLPFLENYFRYQLEHIDEWPLNQYWDEARGGDNIEVVLWLYNRLYDANNPDESAWLITLANKLYQSTYKWTDILQDTTSRQHVVNTTQGLKTPAVMYQITGAEKDKTALRYGIENYSIDHGRVDGLANADEAARENYPYRGTELCSISEGILSESISMRILGEGWIGDDLESLAYNSLPAAYSPDLRNQTYYQAQNQVMLTHGTHDFDQDHGDDIAFGAFSGFECCFPNGHMGWPKFVQSMWMATRDNGLAIVAYGPNTVTAKVADGKTAVFTQSTNYPFEETVTLTYSGDTAAFPLKLRIPEWCEGWTILLNGERVTGDVVNGYLTINRTFQKGDTIELVFPMQVELSTWYNNALSVKYGPLIFGVKVEEDWRDTDDFSITGYRQEVEPFTFKETYPASAWNYALVIDENDIQGSFEVVRTDEVAAQPFNVSTAPITLKVTGQLVPDWKLMGNSVPEAPYSPLEADTSLQTEIELIPTGCTRMHINQIPWVGEAEDTVIREATTAETYTYEGEKTVQFDNVIVPDADDYTMVVTYSGSGDLTLNVNTKYTQELTFPAGQTTVTVGNLEDLVTDSAFRFCYEHYNRIRFTGNAGVTIEKIEIIPAGTFDGPKVTSSSATMDSIKLTTNIDRADGFYTVYYGTESGNYTMTSEGHHERIAYLTGLEPDTTYYGQVEMRVNGVLTRTSEFTVTTLAEESGAADPWSVPGAFTDEFEDATASKDRWIVLGDSVVTYSGGQMNIGDSLNVKAVAGSENWQNYTVEATLNPGESGRDCGVMIRTTNATANGPDAYNGYYVGVKEGAVIVGYADGGWNQMGSEIPAAIEKNQECNLKVVVVGNQFAIFVDDVQVGSIITPSVEYASGQVGLRSYNNPFTCDTFTVRAVTDDEKALFGHAFVGFTDDFDDMDAAPWTALGDTGAVSFDGEKMNVASSSNIKVVAGEESWTDYTVEGTFTCGDAAKDQNCGLMFRTTGATNENPDSYHGYYVGIGTFGGIKGIVVGYGNNSWNLIKTIPFDYRADVAYRLRVAVVGNSFAIYVDDVLMGVVTDNRYAAGQVGVRSYEFPFTCDDFSVRAVSEEEKQDIASATSTLDTAGGTSFHEGAQIQFATLGGSYTYKIQYGTEPGVYTHEYVGLTSKHNPDKFSISGLTNGTTYYLRAVAMSGGEEIAWSDEVAVTPGESDNPQDEIANLQSLLTQAEAVAEKSNVLEDRIAYAKEVLGMSGANRMDLTTAQASLQSAMNQNEHDLSEEEPGHTHTLTLEPAVAATCAAMGHTAYYTCSGCNEWFADAEGKEIISDHSSVITDKDPNNHTGGTELRDAKPATATEDGYTGDTYCLGCGAMLAKGQVIPATGGSSGGIILPILPVNPGTPSYELPFVDVPEGEWYYESVYYAWDAGLINGTSPTTFRPDNTLTVAEAIKLAAALHQLESEGKVTLRNGQVNWYDTYVAYAVKEGIIEAKYQRYTVSQMNAPATRREFVHILHGALDDYAAINAIGENAIPDVKTGDTYAAEIYDFYRAGILTGSNAEGTFHPESSIKRSEVAAILIRMYDPSMRLEKTL